MQKIAYKWDGPKRAMKSSLLGVVTLVAYLKGREGRMLKGGASEELEEGKEMRKRWPRKGMFPSCSLLLGVRREFHPFSLKGTSF